MAKISTPPVPAKMYRHFAIVTIAGTLLLAIFSKGENRQAIDQKVAEQQAAAKAQRDATREKFGTARLIREPQQASNFDDYSDSDAGYGMPTDTTGSMVQDVGTLDFAKEDCEKGFLVQQAKSDEDPDGPTAMKCLRRKGESRRMANSVSPAERKQQVEALVARTLRNTPGAGAGN